MSITSKIENLIEAGNAVTGESRTDLTTVMQDLKDGYGQGGGSTDGVITPVPLFLSFNVSEVE